MVSSGLPEQGQLVEVRQRRYVVSALRQDVLPTNILALHNTPPQHLRTLNSVKDDALRGELQIIWEIEPGTRLIERAARWP